MTICVPGAAARCTRLSKKLPQRPSCPLDTPIKTLHWSTGRSVRVGFEISDSLCGQPGSPSFEIPNKDVAAPTQQPTDLSRTVAMVNSQSIRWAFPTDSATATLGLSHGLKLLD